MASAPTLSTAQTKAKRLGQVFTPESVAEFMVSLSHAGPEARVLEPAAGEGVFLSVLNRAGLRAIEAYEVDPTLVVDGHGTVHRRSFVRAPLGKPYDLVIGNPPYIRWKNLSTAQKAELGRSRLWKRYCTSFSDYLAIFILRSVEALRDGGELIFLTPEYWLTTMHSRKLRDYLVAKGSFSHLIFLGETPLFGKIPTSTLIFRYVKGAPKDSMDVVKKEFVDVPSREALASLLDSPEAFLAPPFQAGQPWTTTPKAVQDFIEPFERACRDETGRLRTLGEVAKIGNGMVSGLDAAFRWPAARALPPGEEEAFIPVVKGRAIGPLHVGELTPYICLNSIEGTEAQFIERYPTVMRHLKPFRKRLKKRYSYQRDIPYWHWVFLRNLRLFETDCQKVVVRCKDRVSNCDRLRFGVIPPGVFPSQDVTVVAPKPGAPESPHYLAAWLSSRLVATWLKHNGVTRGGVSEFSQAPLARIPVRRIDGSNERDVAAHRELSRLAQEVALTGDEALLDEIDCVIERWLSIASPGALAQRTA